MSLPNNAAGEDTPLFARVRETSEALETALREVVKDPEQVKRIMKLAVEYGNASFDYGEDLPETDL